MKAMKSISTRIIGRTAAAKTARCLIAFIIPFIAGILVFYNKGIYPFGDHTLLCMDLGNQYFPMYLQKANADSLGSLMYSYSGILGYNNWVQMCYYSNSLFVPLFRGLSAGAALNLVDFLSIIKPGLGAVACLIYLEYKLQKNSPVYIAGAIAYGMCSWNAAFIAQIMWTDMIFLAPLVMTAYERLRREKKGVLYAVLLGLAISVNFYIGFALCLFIAIVFLSDKAREFIADAYAEEAELNKKEALIDIGRFAVYSVLGGALSAVFTIPTFIALGKTVASEDAMPSINVWYSGLQSYLKMIMPGQTVKIHFEGVNIYTGWILFLVTPVYYLNNEIKKSKRIMNLLVFGILFASMNNKLLDFVWHGFHYPMQLPGRWTFLFSLFMVSIACEGMTNMKGMKTSNFSIAAAMGALILLFSWTIEDTGDAVPVFYYILAACGLVMTAVLFRMEQRSVRPGKEKNKRINFIALGAVLVLSCLQIGESTANYTECLTNPPQEILYADLSYMKTSLSNLKKGGEILNSIEDGKYRGDIYSYFSDNNGIYGGFKGFSRFSSLLAANDYRFFNDLGLSYYTKNLSILADFNSPVVSSVIGEKYILDATNTLGQQVPALLYMGDSVETPVAMWCNPYAFPLGFTVPEEGFGYQTDKSLSPLERQNALLKAMTGVKKDVFYKLEEDAAEGPGVMVYMGEAWDEKIFQSDNDDVVIITSYTVEHEGPAYINYNFSTGMIDVYKNESYSHSIECVSETDTAVRYKCIGSFEKDDRIGLVYHVQGVREGDYGAEVYEFREEVLAEAYEKVSSGAFIPEFWKDDRISGSMNVDEDQMVCVTIPQDGGWSAYVDGIPVKTYVLYGDLLGFYAPKGEHSIELKYHVPGLKTGCYISAAAAVLLILRFIARLLKERNKTTDTIGVISHAEQEADGN